MALVENNCLDAVERCRPAGAYEKSRKPLFSEGAVGNDTCHIATSGLHGKIIAQQRLRGFHFWPFGGGLTVEVQSGSHENGFRCRCHASALRYYTRAHWGRERERFTECTCAGEGRNRCTKSLTSRF